MKCSMDLGAFQVLPVHPQCPGIRDGPVQGLMDLPGLGLAIVAIDFSALGITPYEVEGKAYLYAGWPSQHGTLKR